MERGMSTKNHEHGHTGTDKAGIRNASSATATRDPVCGMEADPHTTVHRATYDGSLAPEADRLRQEGATVIFVAIDAAAAAVIAIADPIKSTTPGAVTALKTAGVRVVMLSGDNATTA